MIDVIDASVKISLCFVILAFFIQIINLVLFAYYDVNLFKLINYIYIILIVVAVFLLPIIDLRP